MIISILLVGCGIRENSKSNWKLDITDSKQELPKDIEKIFDEAKSKYDGELDYVALLAKQVVAGTNYMFLCKDENNYKIAVVYNNLEGVSEITHVNDFDPLEYVNKSYEVVNENLAGGWYVDIPEEAMDISSIKKYFDKATETLTGAAYYPIAVLGHQDKKGTSYALLCYGEGSYSGSVSGIYMLTLYVNEKDKPEIVSIAGIDLKEYNK